MEPANWNLKTYWRSQTISRKYLNLKEAIHSSRIFKSIAELFKFVIPVIFFSILNHPCYFMVYYYLFSVFYLSTLFVSSLLQFKSNLCVDKISQNTTCRRHQGIGSHFPSVCAETQPLVSFGTRSLMKHEKSNYF